MKYEFITALDRLRHNQVISSDNQRNACHRCILQKLVILGAVIRCYVYESFTAPNNRVYANEVGYMCLAPCDILLVHSIVVLESMKS